MSNQRNAPKPHWWQRRTSSIAFVVLGTLLLIAVLIFAAHTYRWDLTTTTTTEVTQSPQPKVTTTEAGKSLLDWLQLLGVLAIPVVVGFGTLFFTRQQAKISEANAENQRQEELLRTDFDKISELLLNKELSTNPNIQSIVRARTLAALRVLNTGRKTNVLRFLHDTDLLQCVKGFLHSLDLSNTDLNGIDLSEANLHNANLSRANLNGTRLMKAYLLGANLTEAELVEANLSGADLQLANLSRAILYVANLSGANLTEAVLIQANLSEAALLTAKLDGACLSQANLNLAIAISEQFTKAEYVTVEQLAQIRSSKSATAREAKAEQTSTTPAPSERKSDQTNLEEAEQKEHKG